MFTIEIPGLPQSCQYCGHHADTWPLGVMHNQVVVTCPECFSKVGNVTAVNPS
jgi:DNA-directed RNA polymerase subunit RPC12/RpoP